MLLKKIKHFSTGSRFRMGRGIRMSLVWHTLGAYLHRILSFDRRVRVRVRCIAVLLRWAIRRRCQTTGLRERGPVDVLLAPFHLTSPLWPTIDLIWQGLAVAEPSLSDKTQEGKSQVWYKADGKADGCNVHRWTSALWGVLCHPVWCWGNVFFE